MTHGYSCQKCGVPIHTRGKCETCIAAHVARKQARRTPDLVGRDLTGREEQVRDLIAVGLANEQIADRLRLKDGTVKIYAARVYRKAGVHSRIELVQALFRETIRDLTEQLRVTDGLEDCAAEWVQSRIGPEAMHPRERAMRLLEEAVELAQAEGVTADQAHRQVDHTFGRKAGRHYLEAGGVGFCLLAWCASRGHRMLDLLMDEIRRVEAQPIEDIRGSLARKTDADLVVTGKDTDA